VTTARFLKMIFFFVFWISKPHIATSGELDKGETLCTEKEDIYFNCKLDGGHKLVSVCAAGNTSPDSGYVQYRYGEKSQIALRYPSIHLPPRNIFSIIDVSKLAEGIGSHLKFENNGYQYVVSNALVPGEVYVQKNGRIIFDKICMGSDYIPFSDKVSQGLQWGALEPIDGMDQH
jgi:hypothetical protein